MLAEFTNNGAIRIGISQSDALRMIAHYNANPLGNTGLECNNFIQDSMPTLGYLFCGVSPTHNLFTYRQSGDYPDLTVFFQRAWLEHALGIVKDGEPVKAEDGKNITLYLETDKDHYPSRKRDTSR